MFKKEETAVELRKRMEDAMIRIHENLIGLTVTEAFGVLETVKHDLMLEVLVKNINDQGKEESAFRKFMERYFR
jgi:hypothetical protein